MRKTTIQNFKSLMMRTLMVSQCDNTYKSLTFQQLKTFTKTTTQMRSTATDSPVMSLITVVGMDVQGCKKRTSRAVTT